MTKSDARRILMLHRPGSGDESDPQMAEALALARTDAELGAWLQKQIVFHASVRVPLRSVSPPPDLRDRILAGHRETKIIPFPVLRFLPLAAAAIVVLFLGVANWGLVSDYFHPSSENSFASFRARMARVAQRDYNQMDLLSTNLLEVSQFLARTSPLKEQTIPPSLQRVPLFGCANLRWHGLPVTMVCFKRNANDLLWLFIADRSSISGSPESRSPQLQSLGKFATASWTQEGRTYVIGLIGDESQLRPYL